MKMDRPAAVAWAAPQAPSARPAALREAVAKAGHYRDGRAAMAFYDRLVDEMQWMARRLQIFGVHVHVGVRSEGDELPAMMRVGRKTVIHHHRFGWILKSCLDVVIAQHLIDGDDVQTAVLERNAIGLGEAFGDDPVLASVTVTSHRSPW